MSDGLAGRPPYLPHSQVLMSDGLAGRPCLSHCQVLMGAGLAGRPPCLPHSQTLAYGCCLVGKFPCLSHSQVLVGAGLVGDPHYRLGSTKTGILKSKLQR